MQKMFTFGGVTGAFIDGVRDQWESSNDAYDRLWLTKETFTQDDEELPFEYKFAIVANDWHEATGEGEVGMYWVQLTLVLTPDSLGDKTKKSIMESTDGYCEYSDLLWYGGASVGLGSSGEVTVSEDMLEEYVQGIMSLTPAFNGLRGFYLDRPVNKIGTTGWDVISGATERGDK